MENKTIRMSLFKNMDFLAIAKACQKFKIKYFLLDIMHGAVDVNEFTENKKNNIFEKVIEHFVPRGIKIGATVQIAGGDVGTEFRRLSNRLDLIQSGISVLSVQVTDAWSRRKDAEVDKYIGLFRDEYPSISIDLFDTSLTKTVTRRWAALVDTISPLCADDSKDISLTIRKQYLKYYNFRYFTYGILDSKFCPVLGIHNMPERGYVFKGSQVVNTFNALKYPSIGLYDWNPKDQESIGDDGPMNVDKFVEQMIWSNAVIPQPESEPEVTLSLEDRIKRLEDLHGIV